MSCVYVRKIFSCFSVVLMENGDVYTFGYGQHGQLGHGDVNSRYASNQRMWLWITVLLHKKWLNFWFSVASRCDNSNIDQMKLKSFCSALTPHNPMNIDTIIVLLCCISNLFNTWKLLCIVISIALIIVWKTSVSNSPCIYENYIEVSLRFHYFCKILRMQ